MAKLLVIFNLVASAASVAGFFFSLQLENRNWLSAGAFVLVLALSIYVLFGPTTETEKRVQSRLQHFKGKASGQRITMQRGSAAVFETGPTTVAFDVPFVHPPKVEVTHRVGQSGRLPNVSSTSNIHVVFQQNTYKSGATVHFEWVAFGETLEPVS